MKLKNRQIIYVVLREHEEGACAVLDSFASAEACEDKCGEYTQQLKDRNIEGFLFRPCLSYYYAY